MVDKHELPMELDTPVPFEGGPIVAQTERVPEPNLNHELMASSLGIIGTQKKEDHSSVNGNEKEHSISFTASTRASAAPSDYRRVEYQKAMVILREEIDYAVQLGDAMASGDKNLAADIMQRGYAAQESWPKRIPYRVNVTDLSDAVYKMMTDEESGMDEASATPDRPGIALAFGSYCRKVLKWKKKRSTRRLQSVDEKQNHKFIIIYERD